MTQNPAYILVVLAAALSLPNLTKAQTVFEPLFRATVGYNDNFLLVPDSEFVDSVSFANADLGMIMARTTDRSKLIVVPNVQLRRFGDAEQDYDSDEGGLSLAYRTQFETAELRFLAGYSNQLTYTSEFVDIDFEDGDVAFDESDVTGRVRQRTRRETVRLNPEWFWDITPRTELSVRGRYLDSTFESGIGLNDYTEGRINAILTRKLSERVQIGLNAYVGQFDPAGSISDSDLSGAEARLSWKLSENTAGWLRIGSARKTDNDPTTADADTLIAGFAIRRDFPRSRLRFDVSRRQSGSSLGDVVDRDNFRFTFRHSFTPRLDTNIGFRYSTVSGSGDSSDVSERSLGRLEAGLSWAVNQRWSIWIGLDKRLLDVENEPNQADGNAVFLGVQYRGQQPTRVSEGMLQAPWR